MTNKELATKIVEAIGKRHPVVLHEGNLNQKPHNVRDVEALLDEACVEVGTQKTVEPTSEPAKDDKILRARGKAQPDPEALPVDEQV